MRALLAHFRASPPMHVKARSERGDPTQKSFHHFFFAGASGGAEAEGTAGGAGAGAEGAASTLGVGACASVGVAATGDVESSADGASHHHRHLRRHHRRDLGAAGSSRASS